MPDVMIIMVFLVLGLLTIVFCAYGDAHDDYRPVKIVIGVIIAVIVWWVVYICTPFRIEKTYEVKPEYNKDKTIQFVTLQEPNKENGDKVVTTYPLFHRFLKDDEVVVVKQRDMGYYWGLFPAPHADTARNIIEIKSHDEVK